MGGAHPVVLLFGTFSLWFSKRLSAASKGVVSVPVLLVVAAFCLLGPCLDEKISSSLNNFTSERSYAKTVLPSPEY